MKEMLKKNLVLIVLILMIVGIIFFYQTKKVGFHEDEAYTIASSVNPDNGLMVAYDNNEIPEDGLPVWKTREFVQNYMTLSSDNYLNIKSVYTNQMGDSHPPFFYTAVHFSTMLFGGNFTKYSVFVVNIIAFVLSCVVIKKILEILDKNDLTFATIILYGLSMGTISMVLYQRMYMLLTLFILIYFYYSIKLCKNDFALDRNLIIKLGITTVLGFLTQYFFAVFACIVFIIMCIAMIINKKYKSLWQYILAHIIYAIIGVGIFPKSINHLFYGDRGISNLGNSNFGEHFQAYLKHLAYAFSWSDNVVVISAILIILGIGIIYCLKKSSDRFVLLLTVLPTIFFFFVTVKMTSFQELRYIMPVIPFVTIAIILVWDNLFKFKYKNTIIIAFSIVLVLNGFIFSAPRFLYTNFSNHLEIAQTHKDKPFVYVYDNFFNHMQTVPEMMIYEETLILNVNRDELSCLVSDEVLENEDSFVLSIKSYLDNDAILNEITSNTDFKDVTVLYEFSSSNLRDQVEDNLYLLSK